MQLLGTRCETNVSLYLTFYNHGRSPGPPEWSVSTELRHHCSSVLARPTYSPGRVQNIQMLGTKIQMLAGQMALTQLLIALMCSRCDRAAPLLYAMAMDCASR
jgi:hypothetical protein